MKKLSSALNKCLEILCMSALAAIVLLFVYSIVMRYIFHSGSAIVDELIKYLFVWFIYLSMALATKEKQHVAVTFLVNMFKGRFRTVLSLAANAGIIIFNGFVAYSGILLIRDMMRLGANTPALKIAQWCLYLILPIAFIWSSAYVIRDIAEVFKGRDKQQKEGGIA